jgi:hypothetical protein
MYIKTSDAVVIVIIATITLVLIASASFTANPVLAWSHGRKSSSNQNNIGDTSNTSTTSKTDLKSLFSCISNGANGPNRLNQDDVVNCYLQTLSGSTVTAGSSSVGSSLSYGNNNPIETSDSG